MSLLESLLTTSRSYSVFIYIECSVFWGSCIHSTCSSACYENCVCQFDKLDFFLLFHVVL